MNAPKTIALAAMALLLASCQTMTPEERRAADEQTCRSYGFRRGTDAFADCLQRIDLNRDADSRAFRYGDPYWGWGAPGYYGGGPTVVYRR
ncbi:hypothetical protein [Sinorhizobium sp. BG8]|uniref:hypothetical protein n=1 Tax=Sinorhizobium sp. BG8 TaxID=2613773 RepID=UPI001FEE8B72|nr:hypothetical protein [Sinorhizobium sp. BG8]